jgi:hypothetical protein
VLLPQAVGTCEADRAADVPEQRMRERAGGLRGPTPRRGRERRRGILKEDGWRDFKAAAKLFDLMLVEFAFVVEDFRDDAF